MSSEQKTVERFQKLEAMLMETDLPDEHKRQLFTLLKEYHNIFSLEDGERGETDLVVLHIDTADTPPSRQRARRMPFCRAEGSSEATEDDAEARCDTAVMQSLGKPSSLSPKEGWVSQILCGL